MGATNEFGYAPFNYHGPCQVQVKDDDKSTANMEHWHSLMRVEGVEYTPEYQKDDRMHRVEGEDIIAGQKNRSRKGSLRLIGMEPMHPNWMQFANGDKLSEQTKTSPDCGHEAYENPLYRNKLNGRGVEHHLPWAKGTALSKFPAPSAVTAGATTGTVTPGDYFIWVVGVWLRPGASAPTPTTIGDAASLDVDWMLGTPWDNDASTAGDQGLPHTVGADPDDGIRLSVVDTLEDAVLPDYYATYISSSNDLSGATCEAVTARNTGGTTTIDISAAVSAVAGDTFSQGNGVVFDYNAGDKDNPSWSSITIGTSAGNITYDRDRGAYKWATDTSVNAVTGRVVRARYFFAQPYGVSNDIGPSGMTSDYREIRILNLDDMEDGPDPLYPEGFDIRLYKVNTSANDGNMSLSPDGFTEGESMTLTCLADPTRSNKLGKKTSFSNAHRDYTQQFE